MVSSSNPMVIGFIVNCVADMAIEHIFRTLPIPLPPPKKITHDLLTPDKTPPNTIPVRKFPPKNWDDMTDGERMQYVTNLYFPIVAPDESGTKVTVVNQITPEDIDFHQNLPDADNSTCADNYQDCKDWAKNGECEINPEYMLYNCASSCSACSYSIEQKAKLVEIFIRFHPKNAYIMDMFIRVNSHIVKLPINITMCMTRFGYMLTPITLFHISFPDFFLYFLQKNKKRLPIYFGADTDFVANRESAFV